MCVYNVLFKPYEHYVTIRNPDFPSPIQIKGHQRHTRNTPKTDH